MRRTFLAVGAVALSCSGAIAETYMFRYKPPGDAAPAAPGGATSPTGPSTSPPPAGTNDGPSAGEITLVLQAPTLRSRVGGFVSSGAARATGASGPVAFAIAPALPDDMRLDDGTFSGVPAFARGPVTFTLTATEQTGTSPRSASATLSLQVDAALAVAPVAPSRLSGRVGGSLGPIAHSATGAIGRLSWTLATLDGTMPDGVGLTGGTVSGTPTAPGAATVRVVARDDHDGAEASGGAISVKVSPPLAIAGLPSGSATAVQGPAMAEILPTLANDPVAPVAWRVADGSLPPGVTLDGPTGRISGTPTAAGTYAARIAARDAEGSEPPTSPVTLVVPEAPTFEYPDDPLPAGAVASVAPTPSKASDPSYALVSGTLPAGTSLDPAGSLVGIPSTGGRYPVRIRITDRANGAYAERDVAFTVAAAQPASATFPSTVVTEGSVTDFARYVDNGFALAALYDDYVGSKLYVHAGQRTTYTFPAPVTTDVFTCAINGSATIGYLGADGAYHDLGTCSGGDYYVTRDIAFPAATAATFVVTMTDGFALSTGRFGNAGSSPKSPLVPHLVTSTGVMDELRITATNGRGYDAASPLASILAPNAVGATTFTHSGELPPGMSIGPDGKLVGTPTGYGVTVAQVSAIDSRGVASMPLEVYVNTMSGDLASMILPVSVATSGPGVTAASSGTSVPPSIGAGYDNAAATTISFLAAGDWIDFVYDRPVTATLAPANNLNGGPYTYSYQVPGSDALSPDTGLNVGGTTGTRFRLTATVPGTYPSLRVGYNGSAPLAPRVTTASLRPVPGTAYDAGSPAGTLASADGTGAMAWTITSGAPPAGMSLGTDGKLLGTTNAAPGRYPLVVVGTDANGRSTAPTFVPVDIASTVPASAAMPTVAISARATVVASDQATTVDASYATAAAYDASTFTRIVVPPGESVTFDYPQAVRANGIKSSCSGSGYSLRLEHVVPGGTDFVTDGTMSGCTAPTGFDASSGRFRVTNAGTGAVTMNTFAMAYGGTAPLAPSVTASQTTLALSRGKAYASVATVTGTNVSGTPTYSGTSLPSGMSMDASGRLGGTPDTRGTYRPALTLTDGRGIAAVPTILPSPFTVLTEVSAGATLPASATTSDGSTPPTVTALYDASNACALSACPPSANMSITLTFAAPVSADQVAMGWTSQPTGATSISVHIVEEDDSLTYVGYYSIIRNNSVSSTSPRTLTFPSGRREVRRVMALLSSPSSNVNTFKVGDTANGTVYPAP